MLAKATVVLIQEITADSSVEKKALAT